GRNDKGPAALLPKGPRSVHPVLVEEAWVHPNPATEPPQWTERRSWFAELEDELVLRLRGLGRLAIARVVRIAQEGAFRDELKAGRLDLLAQERLLDPMQRLRFGDAGAGTAGMIGDDVQAAGLECGEHRAVQLRAVDVHEAEVVVVEHQRD